MKTIIVQHCLALLIIGFSSRLWSQSPVLEKILLFGNQKTKSHVIFRELTIHEGDKITDDEVLADRAWLLRLNAFKRIEFQLKTGSEWNRRILMLIVQEKGMWSVSPILSTQDVYGWYAGAKIAATNFLGVQNHVETTVQLGGINLFHLHWSNPWLLGPFRLFSEAHIYRKTFRYRFPDHPSSFDEKDIGAKLTLGKSFGRRFQMGVRIGWEQIWTEDASVMFSTGNTDDIVIMEGFFKYDSRDWPHYPRKGIYVQARSSLFNLQEHHRFYRYGVDFRFFTPAYRENILAFQALVDISKETLPVYKRIHLGGGDTIRGFRIGEICGENALLVSTEYRIPIFYIRNPLAGLHVGYAVVLFSDIAAAWFQDDVLTNQRFYRSFGIGVHAIWDQLILRLEYGHRGKGWGFVNAGTGIKF